MRQEWKAVAEFEWREWDGESVAYCAASGHTFKLAPVAAVVLKRIAEGACDLDTLTEHVRRAMPDAAGETLRGEIALIVEDFVATGLVDCKAA